jgi:hypothetical protein
MTGGLLGFKIFYGQWVGIWFSKGKIYGNLSLPLCVGTRAFATFSDGTGL